MWARIEDNVVREVTDTDPAGRFHAGIAWLPCGSDVTIGWQHGPGGFQPPAAVAPTLDDARRERDRRIEAGTTVLITGVGHVPMQGREADMRNLQGLFGIAQLRLETGNTNTLRFRDADNAMHDLTPSQVVELFTAGVAFIEACHAVVWAWADGPGVPADFTDDGHWP